MTHIPAPESTWNVGYASTLAELSGEHISIDGFLRELGGLRRADVIEWAGALLQSVSSYGGQSSQVQTELIHLCLEGDLRDAALKTVASDGRNVVFQRRALWLLLQFASVVCSQDGTPVTTPHGAFGKLALAASDCLRLIHLAQVSTADAAKGDGAWQAALLTSVAEIMPGPYAIARAHAFWFDSLADAAVQKELGLCGLTELDQAFQPIFGMSLSETFFALVTLYKFATSRVRSRPIEPTVITVDDVWWGSISRDTRTHFLAKLSIPSDKLPAHLLGTPRQSWATDFSPLMVHPLIESSPGHCVLPDIGYLSTYVLDRVFWLFEEARADKEWRNAFGAMYEWYVRQLIAAATTRRPETQGMFHSHVRFKTNSTDQACDALLLATDYAALFESKGTRLTTRQKSGISVEETADAIRKSVASDKSGVGQLARNITRILRGEAVIANGVEIDIAAKPVIVPVLVWYEESACNYATRVFLDNLFVEMLKREGVDESRVAPLLLVTTHELELFEQCSALLSPDLLLKGFAEFVWNNPADARSMFLRYATWFFQGQQQPLGYVGEKANRLADSIKAEHARRSSNNTDRT
jgi:hypothetical protein